MPLVLRDYQRRSLDALDRFLRRAASLGAKEAFEQSVGRSYRQVAQLPGLPYVCLRVPTGGGKTIMAAHAVGNVARSYLGQDRVLCLWLVPSNAILDQTLSRLRDVRDPYRQMLDEAFGGRVTVMGLDDALYLRRGTIDADTCVVVSTLASFRVEDTSNRRVYEENGNLSEHFELVPREVVVPLDRGPDGRPVPSLANLMRLRAPVVIVDEAHNARTPLSFDTLARLGPSCVIEFTATPVLKHDPARGDFASNVLTHVSAAELKAEDMIKLPVRLRTVSAWKEAVASALAKQRELETLATQERHVTGEYLRPIVLFQAQPKSQHEERITAEALRRALIEDFQIPESQIAVATGQTRELDDVDLASESCPIRFVITVQALREGWDCPSAYILCSVAEMSSAGAVEQILGRVLRMPHAIRKQHEDLNCAYAYAVSAEFTKAAASLRDALIENGFQQIEASAFIRADDSSQRQQLFVDGLFAPITRTVTEAPDLTVLPPELRAQVHFDVDTQTLSVTGEVSRDLKAGLEKAFRRPEDRAAVTAIYQEYHEGAPRPAAPAESLVTLRIPQLGFRTQGHLELFTDAQFLDTRWRLGTADASLTESEFSPVEFEGKAADIDVTDRGKLEIVFRDRVASQLSLVQGEPGWTVAKLSVWCDRQIPHADLSQEDVTLFIHRAITDLIERRGLSLEQIALHKFRLARALAAKIDSYRGRRATESYQSVLFGLDSPIEVSPELVFEMSSASIYAPKWYYEGSFRFPRHLFPVVGELKEDSEELACAIFLEQHPKMGRWVRNIDSRPDSSFWLQTSTDRFYPDFMGVLDDGRSFAVEYKGEHLWSNDDSKEKRAVGELWAAKSGGRCIFVMPKGTDLAAIDKAFRQ